MSTWQQYVDEQLVGTNNVRRAAIIDADDGSALAESGGGLLKPGEGRDIVALFRNPNDVCTSGVVVGGEKYMGVKGDEQAICAKQGACGVSLVRSARAIVVGVYEEGEAPCSALLTVQNVAESLREDGN